MTTTDELLDMSVADQKDKLENLEMSQLQELKQKEERSTALDNIERELGNRKTEDTKQESTGDSIGDVSIETKDERLEELEDKVDYLIKNCKTTSYEEYNDEA